MGKGRIAELGTLVEVLVFPVDKFQLFESCTEFLISVGGTTIGCPMLFLGVLLKLASSRDDEELEEPPAPELRVPLQGKESVFLGKSRICIE